MANQDYESEVLLHKTILDEKLINQIKTLENLKCEMQNCIKKVINLIESQVSSLVSLINCLIKSRINLLVRTDDMSYSTYRNHEIFSKVLKLQKPNLDNLLNSITEFFSKDQIKFHPDSKLKIIDQKSRFLSTHNSSFNCLAISNNDKYLVTGSQDTSVRIWDLENFTQLACLLNHQSSVTCLAICDDPLSIVSGSLDRTLVLWDLEKKMCKRVFLRGTLVLFTVSAF